MDYDRFLQAIAATESRNNPKALNSVTKATGAHQVVPNRQFSATELRNPNTNRLAALVEMDHLANQLPPDISEENRWLESLPGYHVGPSLHRRRWGLATQDGKTLSPLQLTPQRFKEIGDYQRRVVEALQGRPARDFNNILAYPDKGDPRKNLCNQIPKPEVCMAGGGAVKGALNLVNKLKSTRETDPLAQLVAARMVGQLESIPQVGGLEALKSVNLPAAYAGDQRSLKAAQRAISKAETGLESPGRRKVLTQGAAMAARSALPELPGASMVNLLSPGNSPVTRNIQNYMDDISSMWSLDDMSDIGVMRSAYALASKWMESLTPEQHELLTKGLKKARKAYEKAGGDEGETYIGDLIGNLPKSPQTQLVGTLDDMLSVPELMDETIHELNLDPMSLSLEDLKSLRSLAAKKHNDLTSGINTEDIIRKLNLDPMSLSIEDVRLIEKERKSLKSNENVNKIFQQKVKDLGILNRGKPPNYENPYDFDFYLGKEIEDY